MRYFMCLMLLMVFALTACGGNEAVVPPTMATLEVTQEVVATPAADVTAEAVPDGEQTPDPLQGVVIMPGTLVAPATEDPGASQPFTSVFFIQTGGISNSELTIEVYGDGRVVRNGQSLTVPPEKIQEINAAIQAIGFFGLQGSFTAAGGGSPDTYRYSLSVERADGSSRTINAQDGYTPPELLNIFVLLSDLGLDSPTQ
jgi:hypothetical protein